jgi:hypothetical protein
MLSKSGSGTRRSSSTPQRETRSARIRKQAIPQLQAALEKEEISLYRGGEIARLPRHEQEIAVAQWVDRTRHRTQGQAIAAATIREVLQATCSINLDEVSAAIIEAIRSSRSSATI